MGSRMLLAWATMAMTQPLVLEAQTRSQVYGSTLDKQTQTAYVKADVGWQTYQSQAVASNATATAIDYEVGAYAGESRTFGLLLKSAESTVDFALNGSRVNTKWRELRGQTRLGWLYPTILVGSHQVTLDQDAANIADIHSTTLGGGATIHAPITDEIVTFAEFLTSQTTSAHDAQGRSAKMGTKTDVDVGASIDLVSRYMDLILGYRYRSYQLSVDEQDFDEVQTAGYGGIRLGVYF